jgi:low temperature requirement protein LtrA
MAEAASDERVSTLELFFDLVFVFTITQVALIVEHHPSGRTVAQALVELAVIYWMYGGYAWLTNTLGSRAQRQRIVLLLGMGAFLVVSLSVPHAFDDDAVAFAFAYLALTLVHLAGFFIGGLPGAAAAVRRLGTINLSACAVILVAAYVGGSWRWPLWIAAVAIQWGIALGARVAQAFPVGAAHFAERHGLMIIIVLGESVVSVALAAEDHRVTIALAFGVLCGLTASAALWWCYFVGEDDAAAAAFDRLDPARRGMAALRGYDLPHVFMLAGVVAVAAGIRYSLPDLTQPAHRAAAVLVAGGVATYLAALAAFRAVLRFGNPLPRLVAAAAAVATIPVGTTFGVAQQLLALAALLVVLLLLEHRIDAPGRSPSADRAG